jgi:hypothetical protein
MARPKKTTEGEVSKLDAVRRALTDLGNDAKPKQIGEFAKSTFGLDISGSLINNYKHFLLKGDGRQRRR